MAFRNSVFICWILGVSTFLAGCGGGNPGPKTVPAKGVVTYQGKPIPKLAVSFIPEKGMLATGMTDSNGRFTLMTNKQGDGAMVGTYTVAINYVSDEIPEMPGLPGTEKPLPTSPIPTKYADAKTSGLTVTVDSVASKNNYTFDLTD